jgi:hypothetical protein
MPQDVRIDIANLILVQHEDCTPHAARDANSLQLSLAVAISVGQPCVWLTSAVAQIPPHTCKTMGLAAIEPSEPDYQVACRPETPGSPEPRRVPALCPGSRHCRPGRRCA